MLNCHCQEAAERKKEEEEDAAEKAAEAEDTWGKLGDTISNFFGGGMSMCRMRKLPYVFYLETFLSSQIGSMTLT